MTRLFISTSFILFTFCLYGQINYSIGIGPQYNFGKIGKNGQYRNESNFTYFGKGEIYYSNKKMTYHLGVQWNQTEWNQINTNPNINFTSDLQFRTNYFNINPSIGFKPLKSLELNAGSYFGFNLEDSIYDELPCSWINASSLLTGTNQNDFGLSFGLCTYFSQNLSVELNYNLGFRNISDLQFPDIDGSIISDKDLKNRRLQLSFNYHLNDF